MGSRIARLAGGVVACAALTSAAAPVRAQCRLCSTPTTALQQFDGNDNIQLEVQANLDFDRLVLLGSGDGTATLLPNGEKNASGTIAAITGRAMVGEISVHGDANRAIRIELPPRIELYSLGGGSKIEITDLVSDAGSMPRLDSAGNLSFRIGGRLKISGTADGDYRGDVAITVDYM